MTAEDFKTPSDRELLELAAKAAGDSVRWYCGRFVRLDADGLDAGEWGNPLVDDGDALRLAVKLNLTLRCYSGNTCAQATIPGGPSVSIDELSHIDPCAAARRAVVRAAAELGRTMP